MMTATESPKKYARMICAHLKALPEKFAEDPKAVQKALGLSDEEFKKGLDLCVAKKIIVLEKAPEKVAEKVAEKPAEKSPEKKPASPFGDGWDDFTDSVFKADDGEVIGGAKKKDSMEMAAVAAVG